MNQDRKNTFLIGSAVALGALVIWAYWTTLAGMAYKWWNDPQYSQGYLVPAFSGLLLYLRRKQLVGAKLNPNFLGLLLIALGLGVHVLCGLFNVDWVDGMSLLIVVGGIFLMLGGWPMFRWAWPAVLFLFFMVPLPYFIETGLAYPLQRIATIGSAFLLQTTGFPAVAEGNVIFLSQTRIGVVEACSGLSMLMIFFAMATAVVIIYQPPWLDRIVLILSAIPVAVLVNVLRITATGMAQETFGQEAAEKIFHDWAGWLMMPVAFLLIAGLMWLLKVLFPLQAVERPKLAGFPNLKI
jgi:exosortase